MVAAFITLLWRQVPSVHELTRMLEQEDLLWATAVKVRKQSLSERFLRTTVEYQPFAPTIIKVIMQTIINPNIPLLATK